MPGDVDVDDVLLSEEAVDVLSGDGETTDGDDIETGVVGIGERYDVAGGAEREGERLNGMIGLSLNARKFCFIRLVWDRTFLAP